MLKDNKGNFMMMMNQYHFTTIQTNMNELDKKFQELGWRDTTEAYYGLDFTPFMSVVEEVIDEIKNQTICHTQSTN